MNVQPSRGSRRKKSWVQDPLSPADMPVPTEPPPVQDSPPPDSDELDYVRDIANQCIVHAPSSSEPSQVEHDSSIFVKEIANKRFQLAAPPGASLNLRKLASSMPSSVVLTSQETCVVSLPPQFNTRRSCVPRCCSARRVGKVANASVDPAIGSGGGLRKRLKHLACGRKSCGCTQLVFWFFVLCLIAATVGVVIKFAL